MENSCAFFNVLSGNQILLPPTINKKRPARKSRVGRRCLNVEWVRAELAAHRVTHPELSPLGAIIDDFFAAQLDHENDSFTKRKRIRIKHIISKFNHRPNEKEGEMKLIFALIVSDGESLPQPFIDEVIPLFGGTQARVLSKLLQNAFHFFNVQFGFHVLSVDGRHCPDCSPDSP
jgi:hypothetical protein